MLGHYDLVIGNYYSLTGMQRQTPYCDPRLADFLNRTEQLRAITRYSAYPVMFYRQNVLHHVMRVSWLVNELADIAEAVFPGYDRRRAELMALVHDDAEIIIGDYQASYRTQLTTEELDTQLKEELEGVAEIAKRFPATVDGYPYAALLAAFATVNGPEALVAKFADKFDSFGETLHELFAGNKTFTTQPKFRNQLVPAASDFCFNMIAKFGELFPDLKPLLASNHPLLTAPQRIDFVAITNSGQPHTLESFEQSASYEPYDAWKNLILKNAVDGELDALYTQREFPPT